MSTDVAMRRVLYRPAPLHARYNAGPVQQRPAAAVDSPRSDVVPFVEVANVALLVTFLVALLHPAILNPFQVEPHIAWTIICYAFGLPILIINGFVRRALWRPTPFDYFMWAYVVVVFATWSTSFDRHATGVAIRGLGAQLVVFGAVRVLAGNRPALARVVVAALVGGIAMLEWTALAVHLRVGLEVRVLEFPPLEWNGREGLGLAAAIQFGLLIGVWQRTRSYAVQIAAIVLILAAVVECLFMYSRVPWAAMAAALIAACLYGLRIGGFRRSLLALVTIGAFVGLVGTPYMIHLARMAAGLARGPESGLSFRVAAWVDAPKVISRNPLRGTGLGTYMSVRRAIDVPPLAVPRSWFSFADASSQCIPSAVGRGRRGRGHRLRDDVGRGALGRMAGKYERPVWLTASTSDCFSPWWPSPCRTWAKTCSRAPNACACSRSPGLRQR